MAFGKNYAEIVGHLGGDVIVNHLANGGRVANLSVATDESYFNKSGEKVDQTEWHRVVTFQDGLIDDAGAARDEGPAHQRRGQAAYPPLEEGRRGLVALLDRDPGRAGQQAAILRQAEPRERQRRPGRARSGERRGACRPAALRRRSTPWTRCRSSGPFLRPS